jgi:hypothetical protein
MVKQNKGLREPIHKPTGSFPIGCPVSTFVNGSRCFLETLQGMEFICTCNRENFWVHTSVLQMPTVIFCSLHCMSASSFRRHLSFSEHSLALSRLSQSFWGVAVISILCIWRLRATEDAGQDPRRIGGASIPEFPRCHPSSSRPEGLGTLESLLYLRQALSFGSPWASLELHSLSPEEPFSSWSRMTSPSGL